MDQFVITLFLLLSVEPFFVDVLEIVTRTKFNGLNFVGLNGDFKGYTLTHFIFMYILGAWIKSKSGVWEQRYSKSRLFIHFFIMWLCNYGIAVYGYKKYEFIGGHLESSYCSPFLILEALSLFLFFMQIHFSSKILNVIAGGSFSVYLTMNTFIRHLNIEEVMHKHTMYMLLHIFCAGIIIYLIGWTIGFIYGNISNFIVYLFQSIRKQMAK